MAFNEVRQNFASRPLFTGDLGRDLDELERRAGSTASMQRNNNNNNNNNSRSQSNVFINPNSSGSLMRSGSNNNSSNQYLQVNNTSSTPGNFYNNNNAAATTTSRTPLADHHHLGVSSSASVRHHLHQSVPQVSFISTPSAPIAPASSMIMSNGYTTNSNNNNSNNSSYMTVSGPFNNMNYNQNDNNNNNYQQQGDSPASQSYHNVRGPSNSGAWSLLPPQIPRPLGLQRFLDEQFAPPPMQQQQQQQQPNVDGSQRAMMMTSPNQKFNKPESLGRSSGATYGKSGPSNINSPMNKNQQQSSKPGNSGKRTRSLAGPYQGDYGAGRGPYAMNSTDDEGDEDDFDPIASGARFRRELVDNEISLHVGGQGVGEFAQSLGIGTAEAVAARMAAEVARQAAQKPSVTADDLQSNNSASTKDAGASKNGGGPRASEVAIMRRRMERIDDGLARAAMRQQLAQERLKNVVASGLVAEGGSQTDTNLAPLDTGAKPRSTLLMDPSALDPASVGGSSRMKNGGGGALGNAEQSEQDMEAVAKMNLMKKSGLLLMPAVPYEHFKYVAPAASNSLMTKREQEEKARRNPGQAKSEAKDALRDRLDQLELAHEELLVRNRIVPTQPDQYGSYRPHTDQNVDPTSVLAHIDPKLQLAGSPESLRAPRPDTLDRTVDHTAAAYRLQHQRIAGPAGGYGSVLDPRSQMSTETAAEEARRWALAKARNEAEGMSFTTTGTGGPLGASATAQLRTQQDDTGLLANAALRTLPSGNQRDAYDARKKWAGVSFENPGSSKFQGTHMDAISKESRDLYGFDPRQ